MERDRRTKFRILPLCQNQGVVTLRYTLLTPANKQVPASFTTTTTTTANNKNNYYYYYNNNSSSSSSTLLLIYKAKNTIKKKKLYCNQKCTPTIDFIILKCTDKVVPVALSLVINYLDKRGFFPKTHLVSQEGYSYQF